MKYYNILYFDTYPSFKLCAIHVEDFLVKFVPPANDLVARLPSLCEVMDDRQQSCNNNEIIFKI